MNMLKLEDFVSLFRNFLAQKESFAGKRICLIINPKAHLLKKKINMVSKLLKKHISKIATHELASFLYYFSTSKENLVEIAREYLEQELKNNEEKLVYIFGGDGSQQVIISTFTSLLKEKGIENLENLSVIKVPVGSGNDGTCEHSFKEFLQKFDSFYKQRACLVKINFLNDKTEFFSQNVVSIGLDALIVYYSNKSKFRFLGKYIYAFYNLKALINYDKFFGRKDVKISFKNEDGTYETLQDKFALIAFSYEGHKRYGGGYNILPGEENFIAIRNSSMFNKILSSICIRKGMHSKMPKLISLFKTQEVCIEMPCRMLLQCDGEDCEVKEGEKVIFSSYKAPFCYYCA